MNEQATDAAYELHWDPALLEQRHEDRTFGGGVPQLPAATALPDCQVCGSQMAFFFQVALPVGILDGRLLSVWCYMQCAGDDTFIPESRRCRCPASSCPTASSSATDLLPPAGGAARGIAATPGLPARVAYRAIALVPVADDAEVDRLGGQPSWLLDHEAPGSYHGARLQFVLQVMEDRSFDLVPGAPHQMESNPFRAPVPTPREEAIYELFVANRLFFFVSDADPAQVYVFTQID